jgi:DNA modification methylase
MDSKTVKIQCKGANVLPLDAITDFQGTLKKRGKKEIDAIIKSIERFGFSFPFFIWNGTGDNYCLDGHGRIQALAEMRRQGVSLPLFPVVYVEAVDEAEAKQKLLRLNSQYGQMTVDSVLEFTGGMEMQWDELALPGGDLLKITSDEEETIGDDEAPEVQDEAVSQIGEIYELGHHRLMCGDSTDPEQVGRLMGGEKADMVFTDPPYNVAFSGRSGKFDVIKNDNLSDSEFDNFILKWLNLLKWLNINTYYICCNWEFYGILQEQLNLKACIVWAKNVFGLGRGYRHQHEFILFNGLIDPDIKNESDLWQIKKDTKYKHPTQKPAELAERAIKNSSMRNNVILDFFGGSGSTLVACAKTGRICRMMELDPIYCDVIRRRWTKWAKENGHEIGSGGLDG